jgi:hypothetical protein
MVHPRDDRFPALYRLAERIENMGWKFRELIEKKHAMMRERHLARFWTRCATDQRRHAG